MSNDQQQQNDKDQNDKGLMGNKPSQREGEDKIGQDTDNDGRAVKPGHKPGDVDGDEHHNKE